MPDQSVPAKARLLFDQRELAYDFGPDHPMKPSRLVALIDLLKISVKISRRSLVDGQLPTRTAERLHWYASSYSPLPCVKPLPYRSINRPWQAYLTCCIYKAVRLLHVAKRLRHLLDRYYCATFVHPRWLSTSYLIVDCMHLHAFQSENINSFSVLRRVRTVRLHSHIHRRV